MGGRNRVLHFLIIVAGSCFIRAHETFISDAPGSDIPLVAVNASTITVSGFSSGANMAVQMHVAYSKLIQGVGAIAGAPYFCAEGDVIISLIPCTLYGPLIHLSVIYAYMNLSEKTGLIDPLEYLADSRVWLLSAANDSVVSKSVVETNAIVYERFVRNATLQLRTVYDVPGEFSQITNDEGSACQYLGSPYINNCEYDAVGNMLQWLYDGAFIPPSSTVHGRLDCHLGVPNYRLRVSQYLPECSTAGSALDARGRGVLRVGQGQIYKFSQAAFIPEWSSASGLAEYGYVYVPDVCLLNCTGCRKQGNCTLHVAFHGCLMTEALIGQDFMLKGGYLPWADANNIVVLFPQAMSNYLNQNGCFDWWGYSGPQYATNTGLQTLAVREIIGVLMQ